MPSDPQIAPDRQDNLRKWDVSRRRLLQMMGAAAVATAAGATLTRFVKAGSNADAATVPKRLRRWTMVIDLRKCDGCVGLGKPPQCTVACIQQRMVPEPMQWMEVFQYELPGNGSQFVPAPCMQCTNAPCVNVCPVGATFATPEGVVLIDQQRCIGCRLCMAACPYQRRFFNWADPVLPQQALFAEYNVESQIPARRGTVMKCDFCAERPRNGTLPYCILGCPRKALYYGDQEEDLATNGRDVVKLSKFLADNKAYRLKEELGTEPNVYYVPGHGEDAGRSAFDERHAKPMTWPWGKEAVDDDNGAG